MAKGKNKPSSQSEAKAYEEPELEQPRKRKTDNAAAVAAIRKRRDNYDKTKKMLVAAIVVCALVAAAVFAWVSLKPNDKLVPEGQEVHVAFTEGFLGSEYAEVLYDEGVISDKEAFNKEINERGVASQLKPGAYEFKGGMDVSVIVDQLLSGPNAAFTITKGESLQDIANAIDEAYAGSVKSDELMTKFTHLDEYYSAYPFLKGHTDMDGFLLPGTYETRSFGSMEFASARANLVTCQLLDQYAKETGSKTGAADSSSDGKTS